MYDNMAKLLKICLKLITLLGILVFGYLTFIAWTSSARTYASSEVVVWSEDRIWKNLLFTAGAILVCRGMGGLAEKVSERALQALAIIMALAVTAGCVILIRAARVYPIADQIYVYEAAENFYTGDYTNIRTEWYFNACPYQLGLGLLYGILMRVSGSDGYFVLQYAQAVCAGVIVYVSFALGRELFRCKRVAGMSLLCSALFVPVYIYTLYIYGETFGVCFAMLGILFWLWANNGKPRKKAVTVLYWILAGISFMICYTARQALAIVLIALTIIIILKAFMDRRVNAEWWKCPMLTVLLLFMTLGSQKLAVAYMESCADVKLADGMPAVLTVAMGIQDESENENGTGPGSYNAYNIWLYFESGFDGDIASKEALSDIKRTLYRWSRSPVYMVDYMNRKVLNQWNEATYNVFSMTAQQQEPEEWVNDLYKAGTGDNWYAFLDRYQGTVYAMFLIYFILLFRGKGDIYAFLPALFLIGEFGFSMIWEAKSRYVYPYIVLTLPCAARSLVYCGEIWKKSISRWRK